MKASTDASAQAISTEASIKASTEAATSKDASMKAFVEVSCFHGSFRGRQYILASTEAFNGSKLIPWKLSGK